MERNLNLAYSKFGEKLFSFFFFSVIGNNCSDRRILYMEAKHPGLNRDTRLALRSVTGTQAGCYVPTIFQLIIFQGIFYKAVRKCST